MKRVLLGTILVVGASSILSAAETAPVAPAAASAPTGPIPNAFPQARYAQLREKSPFALATPDEAPKAPEKTFADGWKIKGMARFPEGGQFVDSVTVKTADAREIFTLYSDKPNSDGVSIVSVDLSPVMGKSTVRIKKGNEFATLEYDQMDMQTGVPVTAPAPGVARPGQPQLPGVVPPGVMGGAKPNPFGTRPGAPTPGNRVMIPRPPTGIPTPQGGNPIPRPVTGPVNTFPQTGAPQSGNPQDPRRRVRYIGSP